MSSDEAHQNGQGFYEAVEPPKTTMEWNRTLKW